MQIFHIFFFKYFEHFQFRKIKSINERDKMQQFTIRKCECSAVSALSIEKQVFRSYGLSSF